MTIFVLFLEFTAGELLTPFCRSAFQARIAAESRSYGKNFCNDRVNKSLATESTEDTDALVDYSVFFRGFRGHLQGLAFK
jgi:hypothetical protein